MSDDLTTEQMDELVKDIAQPSINFIKKRFLKVFEESGHDIYSFSHAELIKTMLVVILNVTVNIFAGLHESGKTALGSNEEAEKYLKQISNIYLSVLKKELNEKLYQ